MFESQALYEPRSLPSPEGFTLNFTCKIMTMVSTLQGGYEVSLQHEDIYCGAGLAVSTQRTHSRSGQEDYFNRRALHPSPCLSVSH